jgi:ABC-type branched-subunit amino acid transport system ATPase component/ABC-type branched-subunit amino acid transport system permease subunit
MKNVANPWQRMRAWKSWNFVGAVVLLLLATASGGSLTPYWLFQLTMVGIYMIVALGMNLLFGYAGQASLAQGALIGLSAYTVTILGVNHGWSFWPASVVAIAVTCVAAAVMSLAAARLTEWFFALITYSFAVLFINLVNSMRDLTGGYAGIIGMPLPSIGGHMLTPLQFFWLTLLIVAVAGLLVSGIAGSRFGRAMVALHSDPPAAQSAGVSAWRVRLLAFVVAAVCAGAGGALFASLEGVVVADSFSLDLSVFFLVAVVIGGAGSTWGPVIGTGIFFFVPLWLQDTGQWNELFYGAILLGVMVFAPLGIVGIITDVWDRFMKPVRRGADALPPGAAIPATPPAAVSMRDISLRFGGIQALKDVDLEIPAGAVFAIVGSNGSGKTTLLNIMSGFYRQDTGTVEVDGVKLVHTAERRVVKEGIGRTFQTPKLLARYNVLENVLHGGFGREQARGFELALRLPRARRERKGLEAEAAELLTLVNMADLWDVPAGQLSHGRQRLVEIARALMAAPRVLLLDEPAAGLSPTEMAHLGELVQAIIARGITVVIVEHHLDLVSEIADQVALFDQGKLIATGTAEEVFALGAAVASFMGGGASPVQSA